MIKNIQQFEIFDHDLTKILVPILRENVFHVTRYSSFQKILFDGYIDSNKDGLLGESFPRSANSFGRNMGCICLFDYRNKTDEEITEGTRCCGFSSLKNSGDHLAFLIIDKTAYININFKKPIFDQTSSKTLYVPGLECWHPHPMNVEFISKVLDVKILRRASPPGSLENLVEASFC
jgi:hypothetical protein